MTALQSFNVNTQVGDRNSTVDRQDKSSAYVSEPTVLHVTNEMTAIQPAEGQLTPSLGKSDVTAIQVKDVTFEVISGGNTLKILKGIDWEVPQGIIQLLMGPSGSGKTTLLSILAGLLSPSTGAVSLLGTDITRLSESQLGKFRLRNIGFIFQDFNLFPALTARDNVELKLNLLGIRGRNARKEAEYLLEQVGLADKMLLNPRHLSGGQQQRVAIARALAGRPSLIMADEPTASLDSRNGRLVMELLRDLARKQKATVLMVTHDPRILDLADRVATMEDGLLKTDSHSVIH